MFKGVVLSLSWLVSPLVLGAAQTSTHQCLALDIPQIETGVTVVGTYAGQHYEFRITVDGKPVDLNSKQITKEVAEPCAYTS